MQENWKVSAKGAIRKEALAEYEARIMERLQKAYEQGLQHGRELRHKTEVEEAREKGYLEAKRKMEALRKHERRLRREDVDEGEVGAGGDVAGEVEEKEDVQGA